MKSARLLVAVSLLLLMTFVLVVGSGCPKKPEAPKTGETPGPTPPPAAGGPFKIAIVTWPGYGPLFVAKAKNLVPGMANVEWKIIDDTAARRAAFKSGEYQMIAETVDSFASGKPGYQMGAKAVYTCDESMGGDGLIVTEGINTIADLKGKTIAYPEGLPGHFLLLKLLHLHGMTSKDIKGSNMEADPAGQAFRARKVDAAVTWEPFVTMSTTPPDGHGSVLLTSKDAQGYIVDVLVCGEDTINSRTADVQAVIDAHFAGLKYMEENPKESYDIIAKELSIPAADVEGMISGLKYQTKAMNEKFFSPPKPDAPCPFAVLFDDASSTWKEEGLLTDVAGGADSFTAQFVSASTAAGPAEPAPPEPLAPAPEKVKTAPAKMANITKHIQFKPGSAEIEFSKEVREDLDEVGRFIAHTPDYYVRVEGHTDSDGDDAYNLDLSKKRAQAVGDYLKTYTEDPNQIVTVGLGEKKPVASNSTAEGKAKNRRVMFATIPGRG
ncbi:MAG: hypothetical protein FJX75_20045 [Armatimonadetes bacterium]|nr:hypothetical protein [Armatimonadota bacterium]